MIYKRRYIQFNELVIDGYDMIKEPNSSVSTKQFSQEYTFRHGDYVPFKRSSLLFEPQEISMTLTLHMKKLPCDKRKFYRSHVIEQLSKPGKLWAIQNGELVWAYAYASNIDPDENALDNTLSAVVDFVAYEGVWHKADKQKTFLKPYDVCDIFDECSDFQRIEPCKEYEAKQDCCTECIKDKPEDLPTTDCECCCETVEPDMALCLFDDFDNFFDCTTGYQIEYNCRKGEEFFGDDFLGTKICQKDACSDVIAGLLYSDTDIPTDGVTIVLSGGGTNPHITINGNTNVITGSYEGALIIKPNGDVIHRTNCCDTVLDPSVWEVPPNMDYGWEIHRGKNRIVIHNCCGSLCAYFQVDSLTI